MYNYGLKPQRITNTLGLYSNFKIMQFAQKVMKFLKIEIFITNPIYTSRIRLVLHQQFSVIRSVDSTINTKLSSTIQKHRPWESQVTIRLYITQE